MNLPLLRLPFPVKVPFETGVDLYKLGTEYDGHAEVNVFDFADDFERTIGEKLIVLRDSPEQVLVFLEDDLPGLTALLWRVMGDVAAEQPAYAACGEDHFQSKLLGYVLRQDGRVEFEPDSATFPALGEACAAVIEKLTGIEQVVAALALGIPEDYTVARNRADEAGADTTEALAVALPTNWTPREKLGLSLATVHVPVGDSERLVKSSPRLAQAMIHKGPFYRYNWSLTGNPALSQNPAIIGAHGLRARRPLTVDDAPLVERLYFRVERQTFLSYPDIARGVFFIRILQRPLREVLTTRERATRLRDAVASMTAAHLDYKSMEALQGPLVAGLEEVVADLV